MEAEMNKSEQFTQDKQTSKSKVVDPAELERQYGAPIVARDQRCLDRATGSMINSRTLANLDSQGLGPEGKIKIGRKVGYMAGPFFRWFASRIEG
jgi:hypothetical protein